MLPWSGLVSPSLTSLAISLACRPARCELINSSTVQPDVDVLPPRLALSSGSTSEDEFELAEESKEEVWAGTLPRAKVATDALSVGVDKTAPAGGAAT